MGYSIGSKPSSFVTHQETINWSPPHGSTKPLQLQRVSLCLVEIVVQVMCPFWCRLSFFQVDLLTAAEFYSQIWWLKSHHSTTVCLVKWHSAFSDSSSALLRCKPSTSWSKKNTVESQKRWPQVTIVRAIHQHTIGKLQLEQELQFKELSPNIPQLSWPPSEFVFLISCQQHKTITPATSAGTQIFWICRQITSNIDIVRQAFCHLQFPPMILHKFQLLLKHQRCRVNDVNSKHNNSLST